jgi:hypothetical protein
LPVRVLSRLFQRLFLTRLADALTAGRLAFFGKLDGLRRRAREIRRAPPVVLEAEGDTTVIEANQSVVRNGDAVGVAALATLPLFRPLPAADSNLTRSAVGNAIDVRVL